MKKGCAICQGSFDCAAGSSQPCWCFELPAVEIDDPQLDCLCPKCLKLLAEKKAYLENGLMVFTEAYHLARGYCCQSGCRHCPY